MKHTRSDYNTDEPVFLIHEQDMVGLRAARTKEFGARSMKEWQRTDALKEE